jgi:hypothetical protein
MLNNETVAEIQAIHARLIAARDDLIALGKRTDADADEAQAISRAARSTFDACRELSLFA